ncbi:acyl carrier protein [Clostridium sp. E02]|uniref:acyl carrier protein n=1 Tax=Clostridium sp. E02 TaxID=2487134 RepID=UPI000F523C0A|nr:acyl carrier protein [Clostridium sp. E02]
MNEILNYLYKIIRRLTGDERLLLNEETVLEDLQLDSITYIEIFIDIEENFAFEFDDEMLLIEKYPTLQELSEYIYRKTYKQEKKQLNNNVLS